MLQSDCGTLSAVPWKYELETEAFAFEEEQFWVYNTNINTRKDLQKMTYNALMIISNNIDTYNTTIINNKSDFYIAYH